MNENVLLEHLEDLAHRLGIELRYENLGHGQIRSDGGFCKVGGKPLILINRKQSRSGKISILARSLNKLDLDGLFIPPAVRKILEKKNI